ncbi:MAG: hypothetical protein E7208_03645 [Clostridium butyricum]|nr:hypothetical protein [Clostridium butyricum]
MNKYVGLEIVKYADKTNARYSIANYCNNIQLNMGFTRISMELNFTIPYSIFSTEIIPFKIETGDKIFLYYNKTMLFCGKVISYDLEGKDQLLQVTAYDYTWWVCKSKITKNFNNISVIDAIKWIYENIGMTYTNEDEKAYIKGLGDNAYLILDTHLIEDKPANQVLQAIFTDIFKKTKKHYYLHAGYTGRKIEITECDKWYSGLTIQLSDKNKANGNIIDFKINNTIENMVNQIRIYGETGQPINMTDEQLSTVVEAEMDIYNKNVIKLENDDIFRYGTLQNIIKMDEDDTVAGIKDKALTILEDNRLKEALTVECFGDLDYYPAYGVLVKIPCTQFYDTFMYINESTFIFNKDETFICRCTLQQSKHKNLVEWEDIETKDTNLDEESSSEGNSELINNLLAELKSHLGLSYVWGGKSPEDGGMDCSGYIAYCYNKFADQLNIKSSNGLLTSYTVTMMNEGKDVTDEFPNLQPCDIIFPHSQHVVAYIGNGQIIHEPQSGDVCRVSDIYFTNPTKVIRVVPDTALASNNDSGISSGISNKLVDYISEWEGFRASVYYDEGGKATIGYGETSSDYIKLGACTKEQARGWLIKRVTGFAKEVKAKLGDNIALPQNKFDCLVDMAYNLGSDGFNGLIELIKNKASDSEIVAKIKTYNHISSGAVSAGLTKRCNSRAKMWSNGEYDSSH